jgi:hypothetical protein
MRRATRSARVFCMPAAARRYSKSLPSLRSVSSLGTLSTYQGGSPCAVPHRYIPNSTGASVFSSLLLIMHAIKALFRCSQEKVPCHTTKRRSRDLRKVRGHSVFTPQTVTLYRCYPDRLLFLLFTCWRYIKNTTVVIESEEWATKAFR